MVTEITLYECDGCGHRHDSCDQITECANCHCEICMYCEEEEDLCCDCATDDEDDDEDNDQKSTK